MITITTQRGIIELPCPPADDAQAIQGNCEHGVSLFAQCFDCAWLDAYQRFSHVRDRADRWSVQP